MNIDVCYQDPATFSADLLAVVLGAETWEDTLSDLDAAFGGGLIDAAKAQSFKAGPNQTFQTLTFGRLPARALVLVGAGSETLTSDQQRDLGGHIARAARSAHAASVAVAPLAGEALGDDASASARFLAEGVGLGAYRFARYFTEAPKTPPVESISVVLPEGGATVAASAIAHASAVIHGTSLARDLGNEPPNVCHPEYLAQSARTLAETYGFDVTVFDMDTMLDKGMNLLVSVGKGAKDEPRLIHLTYRPEGEVHRRVAFVGKGVTFDTGGYSLKPSGGQINMHIDMGGGAAVLGAAEAIGRLKPAGVEIHFLVASAKNAVSDRAYTVNEVIKGYGGKTVEIHNTDAEGRLCLADALAYATEIEGIDAIIDLATLTGACVVALGEQYSALFSTEDAFAEELLVASRDSGDRVWHMPLDTRLRSKLKSNVADMKNIGDRWGGAITAALFLREWVGDVTWAHLDIAGPSIVEGDQPIAPKGASGAGVALLTAFALAQQPAE